MSGFVLGLDASTSIVGYAFATGSVIVNAGFFNISKIKTNREKSHKVIEFLSDIWLNNYAPTRIDHVNLEAALSGFGGGLTSQQTIITLSRWNAVLEYVIEKEMGLPVVLCNVNTMRKKVLGAARIKGIKPKEYVKATLPKLYPDVKKFEKLNRNGDWDAHNSDMYDSVICALFG